MARSNLYKTYIVSPEWRAKSNRCIALTRKRCILFPWLRARHTHHLTYRNLTKEIPIRDTVPLSKCAHWLVHLPIFWKSGLRPFVNWILRFLFLVWLVISIFI
jgi:hypothetical protein